MYSKGEAVRWLVLTLLDLWNAVQGRCAVGVGGKRELVMQHAHAGDRRLEGRQDRGSRDGQILQ